jgi:hypothetical protein
MKSPLNPIKSILLMAKPPLESWKTAIPFQRRSTTSRPPDAPDRCAVLRPWILERGDTEILWCLMAKKCGNRWQNIAKYGNMW